MGMDQDDVVFIPITTGTEKVMGIRFPDQEWNLLHVAGCWCRESTYSAQDEIRQLLRQRHNLGANKEDDFVIMNYWHKWWRWWKILPRLWQSCWVLLRRFPYWWEVSVSWISCWFQLPSGRAEIGIRMAIGAKSCWDIRWQFLMESLVLSLIGGLAGVAIGIGECLCRCLF